ncbi:retrovirus-related Pol polyprotein from transposon 17.6 [Trichonephila clavipes]|nr:retrovirus-related Pol polyprotein from transposon 17.6 [Trichonephila clavipes]
MLLKKDVKLNWTDECQNAFEKLKDSLITKPILHLYDPYLTCHVFVDASQKSVGAVLKQPDASNVLHPIVYHSRTLRDYENNYAITELECRAIINALDKFYYYQHGQKKVGVLGELPTRTTQPTSGIRTLTSTFAGFKEDTCTKDSPVADQR